MRGWREEADEVRREAVGFADPWEHARLLSDRARNDALLALLARRAPGARVLEVGCGTGLLSCVAARLGATRVIAVEPTERVRDAATLVAHNALGGIVEVRQGMIEDLDPEPVDLAFSELLNADPFLEGILPAMDAARRWVVPGGLLSPGRLRVWMAAVPAVPSRSEGETAARELERLARELRLDLGPLATGLRGAGTYRYLDDDPVTVGPPVLLWDVALGEGWRPPEVERRVLPVAAGARAGGAVVWFAAELEPGVWLDNAPGNGGHWGQLVCGWSDPPPPGDVQVEVTVEEEELEIAVAG